MDAAACNRLQTQPVSSRPPPVRGFGAGVRAAPGWPCQRPAAVRGVALALGTGIDAFRARQAPQPRGHLVQAVPTGGVGAHDACQPVPRASCLSSPSTTSRSPRLPPRSRLGCGCSLSPSRTMWLGGTRPFMNASPPGTADDVRHRPRRRSASEFEGAMTGVALLAQLRSAIEQDFRQPSPV
jgi:hypothetical protein